MMVHDDTRHSFAEFHSAKFELKNHNIPVWGTSSLDNDILN